MTPTNLGALPSDRPAPNGRVQITRYQGSPGVLQVTNANDNNWLTDGVSGYLLISYTPTYDCFWVVRGNLIVSGVSGGWQRWDYKIVLDPIDADNIGVTSCCTQCYDSGTVGWQAYAASAMFRLNAGVGYSAKLVAGYSSGGVQQWWGAINYARIVGRVVGEGVV